MKKELKRALEVLNNQQVLVYPTDTVWGIGCDATKDKPVERIYNIKNRVDSKSLIILVDSLEMLEKFTGNISHRIKELALSPNPTTIIYPNPSGLASAVVSNENTVAIRVVQNEFCSKLIKAFGKPIVSTSANISESPTPLSFDEISPSILDAVDYSVNLQRDVISTKSSTILSMDNEGEITIIRK